MIDVLLMITVKFEHLVKNFSFPVLCCKAIVQKMAQYTMETVNQTLNKTCATEDMTDGENILEV